MLVGTEGYVFAVGIHCFCGIILRIKHDTVFLSALKRISKRFLFFCFFFCAFYEKLLAFPLEYPDIIFQLVNLFPFC